MPTAKNIYELQAMLMKEIRTAMEESKQCSLNDMQEQTSDYYTGTTPKVYKRTHALEDTPKVSNVSSFQTVAEYTAYLDTNHQYSTGSNPYMEEVLEFANGGEPFVTENYWKARPTLGKKNFWERSLKNIEKDFKRTMRGHFKLKYNK